MGIRETINKNPQLAMGVGGGVLLLGLLMLIWQLLPTRAPVARPGLAYFTVDDGQSYFPAEGWNIPPFKDPKSGKEAVRAHVYQCGENGAPFVAWMERYKPEAKTAMDRFYQDSSNRSKFPPEFSQDSAREYKLKKPNGQWKPWSNEMFTATQISCRDGSGMAVEITPPKP